MDDHPAQEAKMAVTVADVARAAGVSVSTVSYTLSGSRKISEKTQRRVRQAVADLGYTPNALARGLRGGHSRIVALIFPLEHDVIDPSGLDYILGASDHAQSLGYHLLLWTTEGPGLEQLRELAGRGLVDGALLMQVTLDDPRPAMLAEAKIPFSLIGRVEGPSLADSVDLDGTAAARIAVDYLAGLGHRSIAMIAQPGEQFERRFGIALRAREGVVAAATAAGMAVSTLSCDHSFEAGYQALAALLADRPDLTAVICQNEPAVGGILAAAADHGLRIPDDLSLVMLGMGAPAAEATYPTLTCVSVSGRLLGRLAVDHLIARLDGDDGPPAELVFPGELEVRRSSGPAPARR